MQNAGQTMAKTLIGVMAAAWAVPVAAQTAVAPPPLPTPPAAAVPTAPTPPTAAAPPTTPCSGPVLRLPDGSERCLPFRDRIAVRVSGFADRWGEGAPSDWMRWPSPATPPESWIAEADPAVQDWLAQSASPRPRQMIELSLDIGPDGRASACRAVRQGGLPNPLPPAFASLCQRVSAAARWHGALDAEGRPVTSRYRWIVNLFQDRVPEGRASEPLIAEAVAPPAPPPPRAPGELPDWPPGWTSRLLPSAGSIALAPGGAASFARDTPGWAGVMVTATPDGITGCTVVRPSGDARFDRRACEAASRRGALTYPWPTSGRLSPPRTPIHFVPVRGRPAAILPVSAGITGGQLVGEDWLALTREVRAAAGPSANLAALRLWLAFDETGRVTRCEVTTSSGDDAADIAACRAARASTRFTPGRDIFGWPLPINRSDWALAPAP